MWVFAKNKIKMTLASSSGLVGNQYSFRWAKMSRGIFCLFLLTVTIYFDTRISTNWIFSFLFHPKQPISWRPPFLNHKQNQKIFHKAILLVDCASAVSNIIIDYRPTRCRCHFGTQFLFFHHFSYLTYCVSNAVHQNLPKTFLVSVWLWFDRVNIFTICFHKCYLVFIHQNNGYCWIWWNNNSGHTTVHCTLNTASQPYTILVIINHLECRKRCCLPNDFLLF